MQDMKASTIDFDLTYCQRVLLKLLNTPSPSGFTEQAMKFINQELRELGIESRRWARSKTAMSTVLRSAPKIRVALMITI